MKALAPPLRRACVPGRSVGRLQPLPASGAGARIRSGGFFETVGSIASAGAGHSKFFAAGKRCPMPRIAAHYARHPGRKYQVRTNMSAAKLPALDPPGPRTGPCTDRRQGQSRASACASQWGFVRPMRRSASWCRASRMAALGGAAVLAAMLRGGGSRGWASLPASEWGGIQDCCMMCIMRNSAQCKSSSQGCYARTQSCPWPPELSVVAAMTGPAVAGHHEGGRPDARCLLCPLQLTRGHVGRSGREGRARSPLPPAADVVASTPPDKAVGIPCSAPISPGSIWNMSK